MNLYDFLYKGCISRHTFVSIIASGLSRLPVFPTQRHVQMLISKLTGNCANQ